MIQENLKKIRSVNNLSIREMANKLGVSGRGTYYAWETGRAEPSISMIIKISETFDITIDQLLTEKILF